MQTSYVHSSINLIVLYCTLASPRVEFLKVEPDGISDDLEAEVIAMHPLSVLTLHHDVYLTVSPRTLVFWAPTEDIADKCVHQRIDTTMTSCTRTHLSSRELAYHREHTHTCTLTHPHPHTRTRTRTRSRSRTHTHTHAHAHTHAHQRTHTHARTIAHTSLIKTQTNSSVIVLCLSHY